MRQFINSIAFLLLFISCNESGKTNKPNGIIENLENKCITNSDKLIFRRKVEPHENAFSLLVPESWQIEGGIYRVNPLNQGGPSQSFASKLDFTVKKDKNGTVMIRWLPDVLYFDARYSPAGKMGLFPEGSNYQGMTVYNLMSAENFIKKIVFPFVHPNVKNIEVTETKNLREIAKNYSNRVKQAMPYTTMSYDAALVNFNYLEKGKHFQETMFCIIENWGQLGAGMWGNKETFFVRVPKNELSKWEGIFSTIQNSVNINLQWLIGEIKGQAIRGEIAVNNQKEIEKIGRMITANRQKTNSEINNDMYLTLTKQEEYVNPYTNEIEVSTNQWQHRWINESGDVIFTNNKEYNPNVDLNLNSSDYKISKVRKRFPN